MPGRPGFLVLPDPRALLGPRARPGLQALTGFPEPPVLRVRPVRPVLVALQVPQAPPARTARCQGQWVQPGPPVRRDQAVRIARSLVPRARPGPRARQERPVLPVTMEL